jgi:predicted nuclease of predicted toxin-antitoxin system
MFRLLLDENLPTQAAAVLRSGGFDAVHAREVGLRSAPDEAILALAASEGRVCVTLDRDLHRILAESGASKPSVILLRGVRLRPVEAAALIRSALEQIGGQLMAGVAATVTPRSIRVRRLPLRGMRA